MSNINTYYGRGGRGRKQPQQKKSHRLRNLLILTGAVILVIVLIVVLRNRSGSTTEITMTPLTCTADQTITPFGDSVLYYDDASLHCLSSNGSIKWSYAVGSGATFQCSDNYVVCWVGSQLYIMDRNGKPTYNESLTSTIQFARIGNTYCAIVIGDDTEPDLIVKDLKGSQIDEESEAYSGMMLLDVGFYGTNDQYMWTLAMDVYGTALNTRLNTFQVGKMNTGEIDIGDKLAYKVLYENSNLRVFTTQQLYTYDYKAVQDTNATTLVYGWQLIDAYIPEHGSANLLLCPNTESNSTTQITALRVINGSNDRRYTLPGVCCGAMVTDKYVYSFSSQYIYRASTSDQRFYGYALPLKDGITVNDYIGYTNDNHVLLVGTDNVVYSVTLPQ